MSAVSTLVPPYASPPTLSSLLPGSGDLYDNAIPEMEPGMGMGMTFDMQMQIQLQTQTQTPGAGPSTERSYIGSGNGRPVRSSRAKTFTSYAELDGGDGDGGFDSGMSSDGDGDEYREPAYDGYGAGSKVGGGALVDQDGSEDGFSAEEDDDQDELFTLSASQQSRSRSRSTPKPRVKVGTSGVGGTTTPKKTRPAAARNMVIFHDALPASELRTVTQTQTPTAAKDPASRSRSASRSLPPSRTEKKFKCEWEGCGKAYTKPARLREHELSHTGERPHVCPYCSQSYIRPTHLTAHLRTHQSEEAKRYICSVEGCGKRFWTGTHARRHEELHREPIPYACTQCDERFHKANHLRDHVALEHMPAGTKGYICTHEGCEASFAVRHQLKAHEKTHDPSRYTCTHPSHPAPENFSTWSALQAHLQAAHPPTCPVVGCAKVFKHAYRLKEHMRVHERAGEIAGDPAHAMSDAGVGAGGNSAGGAVMGMAHAKNARKRRKSDMDGGGGDGDENNQPGKDSREKPPPKKRGRPSKATRMANAAAAAAAAAAGVEAQAQGSTPAYTHMHGAAGAATHATLATLGLEHGFDMGGARTALAHHLVDPALIDYASASASAGNGNGAHPGTTGVGLDAYAYGADSASTDSAVPDFAAQVYPDLFPDLHLDMGMDMHMGGHEQGHEHGAFDLDADPLSAYPTIAAGDGPDIKPSVFDADLPLTGQQPTDTVPVAAGPFFSHSTGVDISDVAGAGSVLSSVAASAPAPMDTLSMPSGTGSDPGRGHGHGCGFGHDSGSSSALSGVSTDKELSKRFACPAHLVSTSAPTSTGATLSAPITCFARFSRAFDVARHLRADHGVEMELDLVKDLLGA